MSEGKGPRFTAAVIGGATAGAEAADKLAADGALCVVFEQNERPYGKVEDGLPMWHVALRRKEYDQIDAKLSRAGVHYVPRTRIGRDLSFRDLIDDWGFDTIVLAHGAWRDRPLPVQGSDAYINRGLVYQNPLIYWFNHHRQPGFEGPSYELRDGAIVVGGGLASIDVVKVLQLELTLQKLAERGIDEDLVEMEVQGIPATLEKYGLQWDDLGLTGCTIYYRRRPEDMPLAEAPAGATQEQMAKVESVRRKILEKAIAKYRFQLEPNWLPIGLITNRDRLAGLSFVRTRIEHGRVIEVPEQTIDVHAPMIISSIGSIPEPIDGLEMDGELLLLKDRDLGEVDRYDNVFGCGNVVTGKGNLVASRKHSAHVSRHVVQRFGKLPAGDTRVEPGRVERILERVRKRQGAVGFSGDYRQWIQTVTPKGFV